MADPPVRSAMATSKNSQKKPTAAELVAGLIISVGEARKLLGVDAQELTDDDIALLVLSLADLAPELINTSILSGKQL